MAVLGGVLSLCFLVAWAAPATARSSARPPGLSPGNRGADVQALQHLLRAQGHELNPDGVFGDQTVSAVLEIQRSGSQRPSGEVRADTWRDLLTPLEIGDRGEAVRALQHQLVSKRGADLEVDGHFGPATLMAVRVFQQHSQVARDGVVSMDTWTRLLGHFARVREASTICTYGDARSINEEMWGSASTVGQFQAAADAWVALGGRGRVAVGDLSREHGGDIPNHASHEVGLDVDIRPIRRDGKQCRKTAQWNWSEYDRLGTLRLVNEIRKRAEGHIKVIWFNDPKLIRKGLVEPASGHDNHLHIRYCEPGHSNPDYRC